MRVAINAILIFSLSFCMSIYSAYNADCKPYSSKSKVTKKAEPVATTNYSNYYRDCPCFKSANELKDAIGSKTLPTSCMIDNTFSVLTGGLAKFTSRDSGTVFNCFFQDLSDKDKLVEVVTYGSQKDVAKMHLACNSVVREFANKYKLSCK